VGSKSIEKRGGKGTVWVEEHAYYVIYGLFLLGSGASKKPNPPPNPAGGRGGHALHSVQLLRMMDTVSGPDNAPCKSREEISKASLGCAGEK